VKTSTCTATWTILGATLLVQLAACAGPKLGPSPLDCDPAAPLCPEGYSCGSQGRCQLLVATDAGRTARDRLAGVEPRPGDLRAERDASGARDGRVSLDLATPDLARSDLATRDLARPDLAKPDLPMTDVKPKPDLPKPDLKPKPDLAKPDLAKPDVLKPDLAKPKPGVVVISELMINPKAAADVDGEWLELRNLGGTAVNINGWTLKDGSIDLHVIAAGGPLYLQAGGALVLGRSSDKARNGGVSVQYVYSSFALANSGDEVILLDQGGAVVDQVSYGAGWTIPDGASLSLKNSAASHSNPASWCAESTSWAGSAGDGGTPGAPPGC